MLNNLEYKPRRHIGQRENYDSKNFRRGHRLGQYLQTSPQNSNKFLSEGGKENEI